MDAQQLKQLLEERDARIQQEKKQKSKKIVHGVALVFGAYMTVQLVLLLVMTPW